MTKREFVHNIVETVYRSSINGTISLLEAPPGRAPDKELLDLAKWYQQLPEIEKDRVREVMENSVRNSVFGLLCVLDGVRAIDAPSLRGTLELAYLLDNTRVLLNDNTEIHLHDMFNDELSS